MKNETSVPLTDSEQQRQPYRCREHPLLLESSPSFTTRWPCVSFSTLLLASAAVKPRLPPSFSTTTSSSSSSSLYFHSFLPSRCAEPQTVLQLRAARCEDGRRLVCSQAGPTVAVRAHSCPHGAAGADADCVELQHPRLRGRKRKRRVKRAGEEGPGRGQQSRWQPLFPARGQAAAASPSAWERGVSPHTAAGKTEALPMYSYRIPREKRLSRRGWMGLAGRSNISTHTAGPKWVFELLSVEQRLSRKEMIGCQMQSEPFFFYSTSAGRLASSAGCSLWSGATLHRLNVRLNERTRVQTWVWNAKAEYEIWSQPAHTLLSPVWNNSTEG